MKWGNPTPAQWKLIQKYITGQTIYDLGCGECHLSLKLIRLGADKIIGVDEVKPDNLPKNNKFEFIHSPIHRITADIKIAFISFPEVFPYYASLLDNCETIIYLGKNYGFFRCGSSSFWSIVHKREIIEKHFSIRNNLLIYGKNKINRKLYGEELALSIHNEIKYEQTRKEYDNLLQLKSEMLEQILR